MLNYPQSHSLVRIKDKIHLSILITSKLVLHISCFPSQCGGTTVFRVWDENQNNKKGIEITGVLKCIPN